MPTTINRVSASHDGPSASTLVLVVKMSLCDKLRLERGQTYVCANGDGSYRPRVEAFCAANALPYSPTFVSVACYLGAVRRESALPYGDVVAVLHLDRVVPDVQIAASDDIRDAALAGRNDRFVVPAPDAETRRAQLAALAAAAPRLMYAEARLFRPLILDDIAHFDDSACLAANLLRLVPSR